MLHALPSYLSESCYIFYPQLVPFFKEIFFYKHQFCNNLRLRRLRCSIWQQAKAGIWAWRWRLQNSPRHHPHFRRTRGAYCFQVTYICLELADICFPNCFKVHVSAWLHAVNIAQQLAGHTNQPHHHYRQPQAKKGNHDQKYFVPLLFFSSDDLQHDWEVFIRKSDPREVWIHSNGRRGDVHEKQRVSLGEIEGLARFEGWVFGLQLHTWKAQCKHPRDEEIFWSKQQNSVATSWGPEVLVLVPVWLPFCTILDW